MHAFKVTLGNMTYITFAESGESLIKKMPAFNGRAVEDVGLYAVDEDLIKHKGLTIYPYQPVNVV